MPLGDTLDAPPGTPFWFPLMRRSAADTVSGQVQLRFQWDVTARGLLTIKLAALERVLAQRREILAALQPVPVQMALKWAQPNPDVTSKAPPTPAETAVPVGDAGSPTKAQRSAGFDLFGAANDPMLNGLALMVQPSKVAAEVLNRHSLEHNRRHLVVTVLEARGLNPRRGVVVALSASELPNPVVTLTVPGHQPYSTPSIEHTLTPRWAADRRHVFKGIDPGDAAIHIRLSDQRRGLFERGVTLGTGTIHASNVRGENPMYVWVPLGRGGKSGRMPADGGVGDTINDLQVFLRVQWQSEVERGSSFKMEVDAAGLGLMVVGGLQDELFNLTIDAAKVTAVRTRLEMQVEGSVAKVQLDNQMLNAVEPVVLAPDVGVRPTGMVMEGPLLTFCFIRSYAGSRGKSATAPVDIVQAAAAALAASSGNIEEDPSVSNASVSGQSASASGADLAGLVSSPSEAFAAASPSDSRGIRSFKLFRLTIAPLDMMTDEAFLEAVLSFLSSLPTGDIWQDKGWQEQQRRLLTAQFGPREVESLAINAVVVPQAPPAPSGITPGMGGLAPQGSSVQPINGNALLWVLEKEAKDLEALHGQSDLSSWFFLESAEIGVISVNVTVSLTSRLLSAGQQLTASGVSQKFLSSFFFFSFLCFVYLQCFIMTAP